MESRAKVKEMFNSKKRLALIPFALLVAMVSLTSCAQPPEASCEFNKIDESLTVSKEISIVLAPTNGFINFDDVLSDALPQFQQVFNERKNASVSIVLADGSAEIESSSLVNVEESGYSQTDVDEAVQDALLEAEKVYRCAVGLDGNSIPVSDESDLLLAIQKASSAFEQTGSERHIFVLSNGLSTAGQVDFKVDGMPSANSFKSLVDQYDAGGALSDLGGSLITWIGMGQTDNEHQEQLGNQSIEGLVGFWTEIVTRSNGVAKSIKAGNVTYGLPVAGSIPVAAIKPSDLKVCINEQLGEDQGLVFKGNRTEFENDSVARASIQSIADKILDSECTGKLTITGYVASNVDKSEFDGVGDIELSQRRADVVKNLLVEFGVSAEVEAIGAGWGEIPDWDESGKFNDELGKANRIVKITQE